MENKNDNINKTPSRMSRVAFPKAKFGVFIAIGIIIFVLMLLYKDLIF